MVKFTFQLQVTKGQAILRVGEMSPQGVSRLPFACQEKELAHLLQQHKLSLSTWSFS
jgi:hypothetical protein